MLLVFILVTFAPCSEYLKRWRWCADDDHDKDDDDDDDDGHIDADSDDVVDNKIILLMIKKWR